MTDDPSASLPDLDVVVKAYEENPTIEEYVRLRRAHPGLHVEMYVTGGVEFVFSEASELEAFGIDPDLVDGALEGCDRCQSELSLVLLEKLIARKELASRGKTHVVS